MSASEKTYIYVPKFMHRSLVKYRKKYTEVTGCQVNPSRDPQSCGVQLIGDGEQIAAAIGLIQEKLNLAEVSMEPFQTNTYVMESKEEIDALIKDHPNAVREYCIDIQLPKPNDDPMFVRVRGNTVSLVNIENDWSTTLGRTLKNVAGQEEQLIFQVQLDNREINDCLFFGEGDYDDRMDFNRFCEFLTSGMKTLDICIFTVSNDKIADAILAEHEEGVRVRIITDNDTQRNMGNDISKFVRAGIPCRQDTGDGHMHNKFAVIDGKLLINGSFNWTYQATSKNYENVVLTNSEPLVAQFQQQFDYLWNDTERFVACDL